MTTVDIKEDMQIKLPWGTVKQVAVLAYMLGISFDEVVEQAIMFEMQSPII
jgi:hypothetical protein